MDKESALYQLPPREESELRLRGNSAKEYQSLNKLVVEKNTALSALAETDPARQEVGQDLQLAQLERDLFLAERGSGGEAKWTKMGRLLAEPFENGGAKVNERGQLELSEEMKQRRFMLVSLSELDRLNSEGKSHDAGDLGLADTVGIVEAAVAMHAGAENKSLVARYGGNEFLLMVDGVDEKTFQKIFDEVRGDGAVKVKGAVPRQVDGKPLTGPNGEPIEAAPITAEALGMEEVAQIFNRLELGAQNGEAATAFIDVLRARAEFGSEVKKFERRVARLSEIVGRETQETKGSAEAFFASYLKKGFEGSELENLDQARALLAKPPEERASLVKEMAFDAARRRQFANNKVQEIANQLVVENFQKEENIKPRDKEEKKKEEIKKFDGALGTGERFADWQGEEPAGVKLRSKLEAELKNLTGKEAKIAEAKLRLYDATHDRMTGLRDRGQFYAGLEADLAANKKTAVVFVDLAFLKYFNAGGKKVGDDAVKHAAFLMEKAAATGNGEAFRYGGDEFAVRFDKQEEASEFRVAVDRAMKMYGGVIKTEEVGTEYLPAEVHFNFGDANTEMVDKVLERAEAAGYPIGDAGSPAKRAELLTLLADRGVEPQKASSRIEFLLRKRAEAATAPAEQSASLRARADRLLAFSLKSMFGPAGQAKFEELTERVEKKLKEAPEVDVVSEMLPEIADWVNERLENAAKINKAEQQVRDVVVELFVRIAYYEGEIKRLEAKEKEDGAKLANKDDLIAKLNKRREAAQTDLDAIKNLRGTLSQ